MIDPIKSRVTSAVLVVIVASIALTIGLSYSSNTTSNNLKEDKIIIGFSNTYSAASHTTIPVFSQANINDFPVDSRLYFLNPYGKAMADAFSSPEFGPIVVSLEVAGLASAIISVIPYAKRHNQ